MLGAVADTTTQKAEEFGFHPGGIIQEWMWDDDVDDDIRARIEKCTGEEIVDEDYDSAIDGTIIWWRDGDDEDDEDEDDEDEDEDDDEDDEEEVRPRRRGFFFGRRRDDDDEDDW